MATIVLVFPDPGGLSQILAVCQSKLGYMAELTLGSE